MLANLLNTPCTLIHRSNSGTTTRYGAKVKAEMTTTTLCAFQQRQRSDEDEELASSQWMLMLDADEDVTNIDGVVVAGQRYEFFGQPWPVTNEQTGVTHHIEATVTRGAAAEAGS